MKIYVLPVDRILKPESGFIAPAHNSDYNVEIDFENWLRQHPELLTDNPREADWQLFQPWWNRYYCNHWGSDESTERLQGEILRLVSRNVPTFTICEYDVISMQFLDMCNIHVFSASRHSDNGCIDIPLLCSLHYEVPKPPSRRWRASFMGKFETSDYRENMRAVLTGREDVALLPSHDTRDYVELMVRSEIALAPRGYGGQSFRFYEAMQFECVPFLIGDIDTRPFKRWIDWTEFSLFTGDCNEIGRMIDRHSTGELRRMGRKAKAVFEQELYYGKWCKYAIEQLQEL